MARRTRAVQCNIKLAVEVRDQVKREARRQGRSFSEEVARRVGRSLLEDFGYGGEGGRLMAIAIGTAFISAGSSVATAKEGNAWIGTEPKAYDAAMRAAIEVLLDAHPGISEDTLLIAHSLWGRTKTKLDNQPAKPRQAEDAA